MHVVIVGGGEVGWYLAERLRAESHDVALVELDDRIGRAISESLDVQVVVGNACHPSVMVEAGVERASLVAGVTQSDEVNLLVSLLAKQYGWSARWCGSRPTSSTTRAVGGCSRRWAPTR